MTQHLPFFVPRGWGTGVAPPVRIPLSGFDIFEYARATFRGVDADLYTVWVDRYESALAAMDEAHGYRAVSDPENVRTRIPLMVDVELDEGLSSVPAWVYLTGADAGVRESLEATATIQTGTIYTVTIKIAGDGRSISAQSGDHVRAVENVIETLRWWAKEWHERSLLVTEERPSSSPFVEALDDATDEELRAWIESSP